MPHVLEQLAIRLGLADSATEGTQRHDAGSELERKGYHLQSRTASAPGPRETRRVLPALRPQRAGPRDFVAIGSGRRQRPGTLLRAPRFRLHDTSRSAGLTGGAWIAVSGHGRRAGLAEARGAASRAAVTRLSCVRAPRRKAASGDVATPRMTSVPRFDALACTSGIGPRMAAQEQQGDQQRVAADHQHRRDESRNRFPAHGQHHRPSRHRPLPCARTHEPWLLFSSFDQEVGSSFRWPVRSGRSAARA